MAHAYTKSEGYVKCSESITLPACADGATNDTAGGSVAIKGKGVVYAKADEDSTATVATTAVVEYTMDSAAISIGGIGADPNGRTLGSQTWIGAKATEGSVSTGAMADNALEAYLVPKNAEYVRIVYTQAPDGAAG